MRRMKHFHKIFFIIIALSIISSACAVKNGTQSVKASIDKKRIFIGDRIRYKVEAVSDRGLEIEIPRPKDSKIGDCEIKDSGKDWLEITSYYVGKRKIPPVEVKYREKGQKNWKVAKMDELAFTVESVLPRGVRLYDIKDIKGPVYPFSWLQLMTWIAAFLGAILILFKILKIFRKKAPPKLPHEIALEGLEAARNKLSTGGDTKEYYVSISDVLRHYIETVFSLRAPEMTTQEFLMSLNDSPKLSAVHKDSLKMFMEACDLVKFAKHAPVRAEMDLVFDTAKKFIEETKDSYVHV